MREVYSVRYDRSSVYNLGAHQSLRGQTSNFICPVTKPLIVKIGILVRFFSVLCVFLCVCVCVCVCVRFETFMTVTLKFTVFGCVDFVVREILSTLRKKVFFHFQGIITGDSFN